MKGMRGLCVTVKAELEEMSPKVCAVLKRIQLYHYQLTQFIFL